MEMEVNYSAKGSTGGISPVKDSDGGSSKSSCGRKNTFSSNTVSSVVHVTAGSSDFCSPAGTNTPVSGSGSQYSSGLSVISPTAETSHSTSSSTSFSYADSCNLLLQQYQKGNKMKFVIKSKQGNKIWSYLKVEREKQSEGGVRVRRLLLMMSFPAMAPSIDVWYGYGRCIYRYTYIDILWIQQPTLWSTVCVCVTVCFKYINNNKLSDYVKSYRCHLFLCFLFYYLNLNT